MNWNGLKFKLVLLTSVLMLPCIGYGDGNISAAPVSGSPFVLTVHNNLLSAQIESVSLKEVLERLSQLADIEVFSKGSLGNETVRVEFKNLPLEEGIRRILQGKSYALAYAQSSYSPGHTASPRVVGIRVVPKGPGPDTAHGNSDSPTIYFGGIGGNAPDVERNTEHERSRESVAAADTKDRVAALSALTEAAGENNAEALHAIVAGLEDEHADVREAALDMLQSGVGPVPPEPLSEMAMKDGSSQNRMVALMLLAERDGQAALDPLNKALTDPDSRVSEMAQMLLENLREEPK
jgi:hypothetical protein